METSKITPSINATNWEQWEFDGLSETGLSGILMGFSRDPSYHFFGQGNLRIEFYMALGDGTIIQELDYVSESVIIECENFVMGVFNSTKKTYSFQITKDMKYAKLNFNSSKVHGSMKMTSITPPHFSDGTVLGINGPSHESVNLAPGLYYNQPIAGGRVEVDASLASGKRVAFHGRGGHGRLWAVDSWSVYLYL
jgi:hypothetical protein